MAGLQGKLPLVGDFITRNLPSDFVVAWTERVGSSLAQCRKHGGDNWAELCPSDRIWRFAMASGCCGGTAWLGVMLPSLDSFGRSFPITVAEPMADTFDPLAALDGFEGWYSRAIILGLAAIDGTLKPDGLAAAAEQLSRAAVNDHPPAPSNAMTWPGSGTDMVGWRFAGNAGTPDIDTVVIRDELRGLAASKPPALTVWRRETAPGTPAECLVFDGIPPVDAFCYLFSPRWGRWDNRSPAASRSE
jgi:type VI secretion system protein ImpM